MSKNKARDLFGSIFMPFNRFMQMEAASGILLMIFTLLALFVANSPYQEWYQSIWEEKLTIGMGDWALSKPLILWINDGLMAIFFFVVGLEIKREIMVGELSSFQRASLPIIAAVGGMVVPIGVFFLLNGGKPGSEGWGIPMATDIAFSLGVLSLLGSRVPLSLKVFLTAFAIVDDIGAVLVIAFFYGHGLHLEYMVPASLLLMVLVTGNLMNFQVKWFYIIIGAVIWYFFLKSGIHPTIAGVLVAFTVPMRSRIHFRGFVNRMRSSLNYFSEEEEGEQPNAVLSKKQLVAIDNLETYIGKVQSPLQSLEHNMQGFVSFFVMPLFAFSNAGVVIEPDPALFSGVTMSIFLALMVGKIVGIFAFSFLAVKFRMAHLPFKTSWGNLLGISILGGVGFTMSLFIANLSYTDMALLHQAKLGVLLASLGAGMLGYFFLKINLGIKG